MFDEMSQKVSGTPETVADLVELQNYVVECRDVTMYNLKDQIRKTTENVNFLMQHAHLTCEYLQKHPSRLNSRSCTEKRATF